MHNAISSYRLKKIVIQPSEFKIKQMKQDVESINHIANLDIINFSSIRAKINHKVLNATEPENKKKSILRVYRLKK